MINSQTTSEVIQTVPYITITEKSFTKGWLVSHILVHQPVHTTDVHKKDLPPKALSIK